MLIDYARFAKVQGTCKYKSVQTHPMGHLVGCIVRSTVKVSVHVAAYVYSSVFIQFVALSSM